MILKPAPFIVISGDSGTGKTTLQYNLADRFDLDDIAGGGLMRAIALILIRNNIPIQNTDIDFVRKLFETNAFLDDTNNPDIKGPDFAKLATTLCEQPPIKRMLTEWTMNRYRMGSTKDAMLQDIHGQYYHCYKNADLHFHLVADTDICAVRKWRYYVGMGVQISLSAARDEIGFRNYHDRRRPGVRPNPLAVEINTSYISKETVAGIAAGHIRQRLFLKERGA